MNSRATWLVCCAAIAVMPLAQGCAPTPARVPPRRAPQRHDIEIRAMRFVPDSVQVAPGDTVCWRNHDLVPHTASADSGAFDSGVIAPDSAFTWVVMVRMPSGYACRLHPTMHARCEVAP